MIDIENKFLIDTIAMPMMVKHYVTPPLKQVDQFGEAQMVKELTTLGLNKPTAKVLLRVFQEHLPKFGKSLMFYLGLYDAPGSGFNINIVGDTDSSALIMTGNAADDNNVGLTYHIGYLGPALASDTEETLFERVFISTARARIDGEILGVVPTTEGLFRPDLVEEVNEFLHELLATTPNSYRFFNAPGGGYVVTLSINQTLIRDGHTFLIMTRFNFDPDIVKLKVNDPICNVVALGSGVST